MNIANYSWPNLTKEQEISEISRDKNEKLGDSSVLKAPKPNQAALPPALLEKLSGRGFMTMAGL